MFDQEFDVFDTACCTHRVLHFKNRETGERYKAFAFNYCYGYLYDQTNYCIMYDIKNSKIKSVPLCEIQDIYMLKQKYRPSDTLMTLLREYTENLDFEAEISVKGEQNVF